MKDVPAGNNGVVNAEGSTRILLVLYWGNTGKHGGSWLSGDDLNLHVGKVIYRKVFTKIILYSGT
jgi:hypothetical protein